jgi:8-oxo-dGTP pyrophosphatase MutT (NUDIX family)
MSQFAECVVREIREELALEAQTWSLVDTWVYKVRDDRIVLITCGMRTTSFEGFRHSDEHKGGACLSCPHGPGVEHAVRIQDEHRDISETMRRWRSMT